MTPDTVVFGRYQLHEQIGAGGAGVVWKATDQRLHQTVAATGTATPEGRRRSATQDRCPSTGCGRRWKGIATELAQVWQKVKPSEASVALKLTAKSGKLTGLLVEGGGEATLTVTLTWKPPPDAG